VNMGGSSDADVHTFWCKNFEFFGNLRCIHADKEGKVDRGLSQCEILRIRGEGTTFRGFVQTSFMDGFLTTFTTKP